MNFRIKYAQTVTKIERNLYCNPEKPKINGPPLSARFANRNLLLEIEAPLLRNLQNNSGIISDMPKAKKKLTQAAQSKRFVETAKKLEADESGKSFEKAFSVITKPPKAKKS